MDIRKSRRSREPWIDMNDPGALFLRLDDEPETDWMVFSHIRAHDDDAVTLAEILQKGGCSAAAESGAQTGHGGGVSYPGLIFDRDHSQTSCKELLDQVVFFIVERRPTKVTDAKRVVPAHALVVRPDPGFGAGCSHPFSDPVHRPVE